eukprot:2443017-Prymnesium_polylepis.2
MTAHEPTPERTRHGGTGIAAASARGHLVAEDEPAHVEHARLVLRLQQITREGRGGRGGGGRATVRDTRFAECLVVMVEQAGLQSAVARERVRDERPADVMCDVGGSQAEAAPLEVDESDLDGAALCGPHEEVGRLRVAMDEGPLLPHAAARAALRAASDRDRIERVRCRRRVARHALQPLAERRQIDPRELGGGCEALAEGGSSRVLGPLGGEVAELRRRLHARLPVAAGGPHRALQFCGRFAPRLPKGSALPKEG